MQNIARLERTASFPPPTRSSAFFGDGVRRCFIKDNTENRSSKESPHAPTKDPCIVCRFDYHFELQIHEIRAAARTDQTSMQLDSQTFPVEEKLAVITITVFSRET